MNKETIRTLRESLNMTQREFAQKVNCSFSLIALVELGKRRVTDNLKQKIYKTFNLNDEHLPI